MFNIRVLRRIGLALMLAMIWSLNGAGAASRAASPIAALQFAAYYSETYGLPPCTPMVCTYPGNGMGFTTVTGAMTETTGLTLEPNNVTTCRSAKTQTTFTDLNGNTLSATGQGYACPAASNGPLLVSLKFSITGGTGKYLNYTGAGAATGWVYLAYGPGKPVAAFTWKGWYSPCAPCA